jgi:hypothetical protein
VLLDGEIDIADLLAVFVRKFVHPAVSDFEREKVRRHPEALSGEG